MFVNFRKVYETPVVYHDEENFDYYIGVNSEKETDSEMETVQIPAGTWIVLKCQGKAHDAFKRIFERFFTEWLPVSEYKYVGNTDIEVYPVGDTTSTEYQFELWLRIEKKG